MKLINWLFPSINRKRIREEHREKFQTALQQMKYFIYQLKEMSKLPYVESEIPARLIKLKELDESCAKEKEILDFYLANPNILIES